MTLATEIQIKAILCELVYKSDRLVELRQFPFLRHLLTEFEYNTTFSTPTVGFFTRHGLCYIAFRGTVPSDSDDIKADIAIARGNELERTTRFRKDFESVNAFREFHRSYHYRYILTGHSLGGSIALKMYRMHMYLGVFAFNPGLAPFSDIPDDAHIYYVTGDAVSLLGRLIGRRRFTRFDKLPQFDAHTIKQFSRR